MFSSRPASDRSAGTDFASDDDAALILCSETRFSLESRVTDALDAADPSREIVVKNDSLS